MKLPSLTNLLSSGSRVKAKHTLLTYSFELVKFIFVTGPFVSIYPLLTSSFLILPALHSRCQVQSKPVLMEESVMYFTSA